MSELSKDKQEVYDDGFEAGMKAAFGLAIVMIDRGIERHGMKAMKGLSPDSYDQCSHGKYRYQDCFKCLKLELEGQRKAVTE